MKRERKGKITVPTQWIKLCWAWAVCPQKEKEREKSVYPHSAVYKKRNKGKKSVFVPPQWFKLCWVWAESVCVSGLPGKAVSVVHGKGSRDRRRRKEKKEPF